jgi:transposase
VVETAPRVIPEELQEYFQSLVSENKSLSAQIDLLREKLRLALYHRFGRSSEKIDPSQQELFEELEESFAPVAAEETTIVASHERQKKAGRKPLDENIPREEILHDIPEEEKICGCGATLSKVDEVVSEELEIIPEQVFVKRHVYPKYACRCCEGSGDEDKPVFRIAKAEPRLLPGSIASPALLAFVLVNKFTDHLPFYRQEKRFDRIGAHISRQD